MATLTLQHLLTTLFLLLVLSLQLSRHVRSDEALIQNLCNKTEEPVICTECLHRDPTSRTADGRGLAVISLNCLEYDSSLLYNYTYSIWQKTPDSKAALKKVLGTCTEQMLLGHDSIRGAVVAIKDGRFDWKGYALDQINREVKPFLDKCLDLFTKSPELPLPNYILAGTNIVDQDIKVALGILQNIN